MNKIIKGLALFTIAALLVTVAVAQQAGGAPQGGQNQQQGPPPGGQGGGQGRGGMDPDKMVEMLTKELNLSTEQQGKIKEILTKQATDMKALRDQGLSREDAMPKMREIRENTTKAINGVLNADQQKKYAEMQEKMRQGGGQRPPGGGGPGF